MSLAEQIGQLPQGQYWIFLGILTLASAISFYLAFRWVNRVRIIEDTPTARIRSAPQGYVELAGSAAPVADHPIAAPLTGTPCCWYRYRIDRRGDKHWRTLESDTSDDPFLLRDETGECLIDPEGAEVVTENRDLWYGYQRYPSNRNPKQAPAQGRWGGVLKLLHRDLSIGRYRYTEERILDGQSLYTIGNFKSLDDLDYRQEREQQIRQRLQHWKQDRARLLARFDLNRDGEVDAEEWELVREAAARQQQERPQMQGGIPNRISAGQSSKYPFLISTLPQFSLARRYRIRAGVATLLFFLLGGVAVWMFSLRAF